MPRSGEETVLYRFSGGVDGAFPQDMIQDDMGNLYGLTESGYSSSSANGALFKLDSTGQFSVIYSFPGGADGSFPYWRLAQGNGGVLYGVTESGGDPACAIGLCGVVFSLNTATGAETVLHSFGDRPDDGAEPSGALLNVAGNLFGTTYFGGNTNSICSVGCGVVYGVASNGTYQVLHRFTGGADGFVPTGALVQGSEGSLYGAAAGGGNNNNGVIFKISRN